MKKEYSEHDIDWLAFHFLIETYISLTKHCVVTRLDPSRKIFRQVTALLM